MSEKIVVPVLGESITEATVAKWLKSKGDSVEADEPIVELETDKVNLEVPSPSDGILGEINFEAGSTVEVGATLGSIMGGQSASKNDKIENYHTHSHKLGIVPKDLNKLKNKLFGIECNFEELNGIDFKKGCYVGQENTARIKLKNKLSKRLLPIEIIDGELIENESVLNNNVEIGKVLINETYPFALIKYLDSNFEKDKIFQGKNGSFKVFVPEWLKI